MTRTEIIRELKNYFCIQELVCHHTYLKFRETSWQFLDTELLHTLLVVRKMLNKPITVNNWHTGGNYSQRGLRCNICALVKDKTSLDKIYLSAHCNGAGIDFNVPGMDSEKVREEIKRNEVLLHYPIRLKEGVSWVHLDVYDLCNGKKVNTFKG
jgi:hypothetical protein